MLRIRAEELTALRSLRLPGARCAAAFQRRRGGGTTTIVMADREPDLLDVVHSIHDDLEYLIVDQKRRRCFVHCDPEGDKYTEVTEVPFGEDVLPPLARPITIDTSKFYVA